MAQHALTSRRKLLQLTGGDLALEKCVYSYMGWKNHKGGEILGSKTELPGAIQIKENSGDTTTIKIKEAWDSERILGVRRGLDGKDNIELQHRIQEALTLAGRIKMDPLTIFDSEIVFRERWMSTIRYCLPITRFTKYNATNWQK